MAQRKITSFFTSSPDTTKKVDEAKVEKKEQKRPPSRSDSDLTDIDEIENKCEENKKSPISKPVPTVTISDDEDEDVKGKLKDVNKDVPAVKKVVGAGDEDDDDDEDIVLKPRTRAPKRIIESSEDEDTIEDVVNVSVIKRKSTPKRKARPEKVEDGIIGMKVRSPVNGRS